MTPDPESSLSLLPLAVMVGIGAPVLAAIVTAATWRHARTVGMLDWPNERSLHTTPVPRGGGLGIVVVMMATLALVGALGLVPHVDAIAAIVGIGLIAAIGWLDDCYRLRPARKALAQLGATGIVVACGVPETAWLGTTTLQLGVVGPVLYGVAILWCVNLYNFMDGVDGVAGIEGVAVALPAAAAFAAAGQSGWALLCLATALACAVFLRWNWAPARMFMGDVGSGALGFGFALIAVHGERSGALPALVVLILLAVFVTDATATLIRRVARGQSFLRAHRTHAYQSAVTAGVSHSTVALVILALDVLVCWPGAFIVLRHPDLAPWVVVAIASIMAGLWFIVNQRYRDARVSDLNAH